MSFESQSDKQIQAYLDTYRAEHGDSISVEEVGELVASLMKAVSPASGLANNQVSNDLNEMVESLTMVQQELLMMNPLTLSSVSVPEAQEELDAVITATESSAGTIMDAADKLAVLGEELDDEHADTIGDISTILFEATSFQDICGQRVNKVKKLLTSLTENLSSLAMLVGDEKIIQEDDHVEFDEAGFAVDEGKLLHGPQLDGDGNSQDDIDALLASFD